MIFIDPNKITYSHMVLCDSHAHTEIELYAELYNIVNSLTITISSEETLENKIRSLYESELFSVFKSESHHILQDKIENTLCMIVKDFGCEDIIYIMTKQIHES